MNEQAHWWQSRPWRMVQTNLREIDMEDIDAQVYAQSLADFGATVAMINAGGIVASYPTALDFQPKSQYLHGSSLREIIDACHERDIKVIARMDFSKIKREIFKAHPDWAFRTAGGEVIDQNGYIQTCPSSEYQQGKALEILQEVLTTHPFDGVYLNMSGFIATDYSGKVYGMCQCDHCREGFKAATGMEAPAAMDPTNPAVRKYMGYQAKLSGLTRQNMVKAIKAISSEIAIDKVDFLRTESHSDIGHPIWIYSASDNARQTAGLSGGPVCDNTSVDFMGFRYRHSSVSPDLMALRQWQNIANGGNPSLYIMGRLDNHRDISGLEPTQKVFQFHRDNEAVFQGLKNAGKVVLVHKSQQARTDPESYGWTEALTASHIPFLTCKPNELTAGTLEGKKLVILADVKALIPEQVRTLDAFAVQGGTVLSSGDNGFGRLAPDCMGIKVLGIQKGCMSSVFELGPGEEDQFPRCVKAPLIPFGPELLKLAPALETKTCLTVVPEHPFGPPECCYCGEEGSLPGLAVHPSGQGKGICLAGYLGSFYHSEGHQNTLNLMQDVLFSLCGAESLAPDLTSMVEVTLREKEGLKLLQLVNGTGCFANKFYPPVPVSNITLRLSGTSGVVSALNGGHVTAEQKDDALEIKLDILGDYEMIVIE